MPGKQINTKLCHYNIMNVVKKKGFGGMVVSLKRKINIFHKVQVHNKAYNR